MADGLSVAASVVGIVAAAVQTVQLLSTTISNIKDAPDVIQNLKVDLQAVEAVLCRLKEASQDENTQAAIGAEVKSAVVNCHQACADFQKLLERWMKNSTKERMFWADRWKAGFFGREKIKRFTDQLRDCKSTLTLALSTTTMYAPK
jgi:hypothetical protein